MSLVAYGSSDDSEEELATSQESTTIIASKISDSSGIKRREAVKIKIPSLKEFEDEESPVVLKKPKLQSGSGLFSLLPPPKNTSSLSKPGFVPYVLSKKETPSNPQQSKNKSVKTEIPDVLKSYTSKEYDDEIYNNAEKSSSDNSHCPVKSDFFSLDDLSSTSKLNDKISVTSAYSETGSLLDITENIGLNQTGPLQLPCSSSSDLQQSILPVSSDNCYYSQEQEIDQQSYTYENHYAEPAADLNSKESFLNDKEFLKMQGRRREFENIEIKDIKAEDQLLDKNEFLIKSVTEETTHRPSRKRHNMFTQQQKRKHQITYLAFQAKEREMDLKNQWAMNNRTRRETQAKYGF